jgi:hypothetical protein
MLCPRSRSKIDILHASGGKLETSILLRHSGLVGVRHSLRPGLVALSGAPEPGWPLLKGDQPR